METVATINYDFQKALLALYYLLVYADGHLTENEIRMGEIMRDFEGIDKTFYDTYLKSVGATNQEKVYTDCITSLKKCDHSLQVRCIAWLSNIANADGFMDKSEWGLIYRLYYKELHIELAEIMNVQKTLPRGLIG